jgi:hypothetical protein
MSRKQKSRAFWVRVVGEFEGRDPRPTHVTYAAEKRVRVGTFRLWLYRLRREKAEVEPALSLVPVELSRKSVASGFATTTALGAGPIDAALPGGVVLRFEVGTDPEYIGALLGAAARRLG